MALVRIAGLSVRSQTEEDRNDELVFVGMKPPKQYNDGLEKEMELAHKKRKQEQAYNKEGGRIVPPSSY